MIGVAARSPVADRLNRSFDRAVGLHVRIGSRLVHSWRFFSLAAFAVATVTWLAIGVARDLPVGALALLPAVSFAIFSVQHCHTLRTRGPVRFIFHRHVAASALVVVPLLAATDSLRWEVIDTATTAVVAGLAVGRAGCLRAGCCAGRPAAVGPRYPWLGAGERRLPVQVLDAATCVVLVVATLACRADGLATAVGLGGYFTVRFFLDELREERRAARRLTEAQWLALTAAALGGAAALGLR
jgi:Prolipoprotein diacylglyceryl transferase